MKRNKAVLCVEADSMSAMVRRLVLKSFGYDVVVAHDPRDAMALMRVREIVAVVLVCDDAQIESAVRSLQVPSAVPVIVVAETPFVDFEIRRRVSAVLTRGDRPEKLKSALRRAIDGLRVSEGPALLAFTAGYVTSAAKRLFRSLSGRGERRDVATDSRAKRSQRVRTRSLGAAAAAAN